MISKNNQYKTNNRRKIMEFLVKNKDRTVSVSDIDTHLRNSENPVNLTTIYRYLDKLEKNGNIIKYKSEKGSKTTYQYVDTDHRCDEHLHLKCTGCGKIIHLDCCFMNDITDHIARDHGFDIQCKNSVIYGLCRDCKEIMNR